MVAARLLLGALALAHAALPSPVPSTPSAAASSPAVVELPFEVTPSSGSNWLGLLSSWGWGEGEVQILLNETDTPNPVFPSRSASFAPRLSSTPSADRNLTNPLRGRLLPITSFPPLRLPTSNASYSSTMYGCPPPSRERFAPHLAAVKRDALVALILRGGACTFSAKVRFAQSVGAAAVLVGDEALPGEPDEAGRLRKGPLVTMFSPDDASDLVISASFVSRAAYLTLIDELERSPLGVEVQLSQDDAWEWPLLDLLLLLLFLPSLLTLTTLCLHHARAARKRRQERAAPSLVESLPTRIWSAEGWEKESSHCSSSASSVRSVSSRHAAAAAPASQADNVPLSPPVAISQPSRTDAGPEDESAVASTSTSPPNAGFLTEGGHAKKGTKSKKPFRPHAYFSVDECSICLEDFVDGDEVRILPCGHIFHRHEIDSWLTGWKKLCPQCKADISIQPLYPVRHGRKSSRTIARDVAAALPPTERTPLLALTVDETATGEGGTGPDASRAV